MNFPYLDGYQVVPVEFRDGSGKWHKFWGYLDSGAAHSVFHSDIADILGIDVHNKGERSDLTVGNGSKIETFVHKIPVRFAGEEFVAEISFSSGLGIGTNILGMKSFFDKFRICFNNKKQIVEVEYS